MQVLKKMLKAVEQLPICADDLHLTRSAHGTFADMLQHLTCHPETEVCMALLMWAVISYDWVGGISVGPPFSSKAVVPAS